MPLNTERTLRLGLFHTPASSPDACSHIENCPRAVDSATDCHRELTGPNCHAPGGSPEWGVDNLAARNSSAATVGTSSLRYCYSGDRSQIATGQCQCYWNCGRSENWAHPWTPEAEMQMQRNFQVASKLGRHRQPQWDTSDIQAVRLSCKWQRSHHGAAIRSGSLRPSIFPNEACGHEAKDSGYPHSTTSAQCPEAQPERTLREAQRNQGERGQHGHVAPVALTRRDQAGQPSAPEPVEAAMPAFSATSWPSNASKLVGPIIQTQHHLCFVPFNTLWIRLLLK